MSAEIRGDLATAASTVEGIACHPYFVQDYNPGRAYVRLDRIEYPSRFGGVCHWNVVVLLPTDQAAAEKYLEDKILAVRDAVSAHMTVTQIQPQRLEIKGVGTLLCAFINGHREQE